MSDNVTLTEAEKAEREAFGAFSDLQSIHRTNRNLLDKAWQHLCWTRTRLRVVQAHIAALEKKEPTP